MHENKYNNYRIPAGLLITFLEKALLLIHMETHLNDVSSGPLRCRVALIMEGKWESLSHSPPPSYILNIILRALIAYLNRATTLRYASNPSPCLARITAIRT